MCVQDIEHDQRLQDMHEAAEKFNPRTKTVFKYLQVLSACSVSFVHGSKDVANSIGSFTASLYVYWHMSVSRAWCIVCTVKQDDGSA